MKRVVIFETAKELLNAAARERFEGDNSPTLPPDANLEFDFSLSTPEITINATGFALSDELTINPVSVLEELADRAGFSGASAKSQVTR